MYLIYELLILVMLEVSMIIIMDVSNYLLVKKIKKYTHGV